MLQILTRQMPMLRHLTHGKILNAKIINNLKKESETIQRKIQPIGRLSDQVLNVAVDAKYKNWLYEQIDDNQKDNIPEKLFVHETKI